MAGSIRASADWLPSPMWSAASKKDGSIGEYGEASRGTWYCWGLWNGDSSGLVVGRGDCGGEAMLNWLAAYSNKFGVCVPSDKVWVI